MKRRTIGITTAVAALGAAAGGVAYAVIGGTLAVPDLSIGLVTGQGSNSCQTTAITFTVPSPTWSNVVGDYVVSSIDYSGITTPCVNLGTADLTLNITASGGTNSLTNATALNMSNASGTLILSTAITYSDATTGRYNWTVKNV